MERSMKIIEWNDYNPPAGHILLKYTDSMLQVGMDTRKVVAEFCETIDEWEYVALFKIEDFLRSSKDYKALGRTPPCPLSLIGIETQCRRSIELTFDWQQVRQLPVEPTWSLGEWGLRANVTLNLRVGPDAFRSGAVQTIEAFENLASTLKDLKTAIEKGAGESCRIIK